MISSADRIPFFLNRSLIKCCLKASSRKYSNNFLVSTLMGQKVCMSGTHERRLLHPKEEGITCTLAHCLTHDRHFCTQRQTLLKRMSVVLPVCNEEKERKHVLREISIQ